MDWIPSPLHVLKTSADIVYSVGDDEGEIKDVFLKPYVSDYGGPFNTLVTLPALNAPLQTWDIVIGKRPKGKLRVYGLSLTNEEERKKLLAPEKPLFWGNTWYDNGVSSPSVAQMKADSKWDHKNVVLRCLPL